MNDFNNLQVKEAEETGEDTEGDSSNQEDIIDDTYCQDLIDNDPHFQREIDLINQGIASLEEKIKKLSEQSGVLCSTTTRLGCIAHKASNYKIGNLSKINF